MARPVGPSAEYSELRPVLLHHVCRWANFYDNKTGARTADIRRSIAVMYGESVHTTTLKRHLEYLESEHLVEMRNDEDFGAGSVWMPTLLGIDAWLELVARDGLPRFPKID